jgi:hypothetical protein
MLPRNPPYDGKSATHNASDYNYYIAANQEAPFVPPDSVRATSPIGEHAGNLSNTATLPALPSLKQVTVSAVCHWSGHAGLNA